VIKDLEAEKRGKKGDGKRREEVVVTGCEGLYQGENEEITRGGDPEVHREGRKVIEPAKKEGPATMKGRKVLQVGLNEDEGEEKKKGRRRGAHERKHP